MVRSNPQIWRVAAYLFQKFQYSGWDHVKDFYYDETVKLLNKINNQEFTSHEDNHGD